jgi:hypothetical protein
LEDLEEWDLKANIVAQVFDTTACNTGVRSGAATLLEDCKSMKTLLWLACRHHILELILGAFWSSLFKKEKKANYNIDFKDFQQEWICAEKAPLKKLNRFLDLESSFLKKKADETRVFLEKQVKCKHRRGDYKEAAELALYLLGGPEPKVWKTCGANHHARWMSHLLYAPKMFIFKEDLLDSDIAKLKIFLTFSSVIYVKAWLEATKGSDAPINDIHLFNDLGALGQITGFSNAAQKAQEVLNRHSWYLTEEVSVFSLFSNKVSAKEKANIALKLIEVGKPLAINSGKPNLPSIHKNLEVLPYIGKRSWLLFHNLNDKGKWLKLPPSEWEEDGNFLKMKHFIKTVKVTNDVAERGIKLCSDYLQILTKVREKYFLKVFKVLFRFILQNVWLILG